MKSVCVSVFADPNYRRSCLCSLLPTTSLLCLVFFIGSAFIAPDYKEKLSIWGLGGSLQNSKVSQCRNKCRPHGSEALPKGIVSKTSNLEMRPLWGSPKASYNTDSQQTNVNSTSNLFAMAIGINQKDLVNKMVKKFLSSNFVVMLFHYDGIVNEWKDFEWNNRVIHISAVNQTKWWFAKRFLHPDIVSEYSYIFLWDEDLGVEDFHPEQYVSIIKREGLEISQPALDPNKSEVHHQITAQGRRAKVHRRIYKSGGSGKGCDGSSTAPPCTGWIEMMAPVFSKAAWRCVWYMIQNDLIHAWGLDMQLGYCAQGDRTKNVGVVDAEYIVHYGRPTLGGTDENQEKKALKEEKLKQEDKYMWAIVDGVKEKVGNFRVEPPGLFRGRGEHPKMGKLKNRIRPRDITINIAKNAPIPECPIPGESWKEVRHDNTVTWLAFWNDPINPKEFKYVFLAASSTLKGQSDKEKYEKARMLKDYIENIRAAYTKNFTSKDVTKRQIAVATYLIDKLALRAGNEKDDDEADTVGCCTLKVENVKPVAPNMLEFNFLGKDSIRYENKVEVELPVYKAIIQFQNGKQGSDDLFDQLDTSKLNAHLKELMPGLTAKVFRTYNASITLDEMLNRETRGGDVADKIVVYQHANKEVAIICNHQRSVSKSHSQQMSRLTEKISELQGLMKELKTDLDRAKKGKPPLKSADGKRRNLAPEAIEKKISQTNAKIEKMERDMQTKEDLKTVALGTSKINYLDPRITVSWCKRHEVPIEKIFNKSLLAKFCWAMDVDPDFRF